MRICVLSDNAVCTFKAFTVTPSYPNLDNIERLKSHTLKRVRREAGYATGMYGKWHLGYHPPLLPASQGFDDFIGLGSGDGDHHTHIDRSGRKDWWHNNELNMEDGYSTDLITNHSIDFIKAHKDEPFFLYVSHLSIHFPWQGPDDPPHRLEGTDYANEKWGLIPDRQNVSPHVKDQSAYYMPSFLFDEHLRKCCRSL